MQNIEIIGIIITACGSAFTAGLFSIITKRMERNNAERKEQLDQQNKMLESIHATTEKIKTHDDIIVTLSTLADSLKEDTDANSQGVKVLMRYMLQRYHATYMIRGYITSHEKTEFLEAYQVYKAKGGNGTAEGWVQDVKALPVRDDLGTVNPYLEILKKGEK